MFIVYVLAYENYAMSPSLQARIEDVFRPTPGEDQLFTA